MLLVERLLPLLRQLSQNQAVEDIARPAQVAPAQMAAAMVAHRHLPAIAGKPGPFLCRFPYLATAGGSGKTAYFEIQAMGVPKNMRMGAVDRHPLILAGNQPAAGGAVQSAACMLFPLIFFVLLLAESTFDVLPVQAVEVYPVGCSFHV